MTSILRLGRTQCLVVAFASMMLTTLSQAQLSFTHLGGAVASPVDISSDGSFIAGWSYPGFNLVRWSKTSGVQYLGSTGYPGGISADGSVIAGSSSSLFRWSSNEGFSYMPEKAPSAQIYGLSGDGQVAVGTISSKATRWVNTTSQSLGTLPGGSYSAAYAISEDGSTIVGSSEVGDQREVHAFRWTESLGMVDLGLLGGINSLAMNVSADGSYIVGYGVPPPGKAGLNGFIWNEANGYTTISSPGLAIAPEAISTDGTLVVGSYRFNNDDSLPRGFLWTPRSGVRDLVSVLNNEYGFGGQLDDWSFLYVTEMSSDGRYIIGSGQRNGVAEGWLLDRGLAPPELNRFVPVPEPATYATAAAALLFATALVRTHRRGISRVR